MVVWRSFKKTAGKYIWLQPVPETTPVKTLGATSPNVGLFVKAILTQPQLTLPGKFVLADVETTTMGGILRTWSKATGKESQYIQVGLDDVDRLWPAWGREMGTMVRMWDELQDRSWTGEEVITKEELRVEGLVGLEESFKQMDWSFV